VWRESATASFTNLGVVDPDFRYEAAQHVRFSIIRFQLFFPAEVEISHCGSNLASTTLLLLDSVRQTLISSMDGSPPTVACSRPTLGLLRVAAQAGVYYAVGCVAGTVQVDVSKLLGATSPAIISMQTTAVTGTLRTDITCSPLPAE
jgi:hypothetical protein